MCPTRSRPLCSADEHALRARSAPAISSVNDSPRRPARLTRFLPFALVALLGVTLFPGLTAVDAIDEREARDLLTAYESTNGREWLTTLYAHEPFFEKPLTAYTNEVLVHQAARRWPALADVE